MLTRGALYLTPKLIVFEANIYNVTMSNPTGQVRKRKYCNTQEWVREAGQAEKAFQRKTATPLYCDTLRTGIG